jgi:hypothetical protein
MACRLSGLRWGDYQLGIAVERDRDGCSLLRVNTPGNASGSLFPGPLQRTARS